MLGSGDIETFHLQNGRCGLLFAWRPVKAMSSERASRPWEGEREGR